MTTQRRGDDRAALITTNSLARSLWGRNTDGIEFEMSRLLRILVLLAAALTMTMSPVLAKDIGIYQTTDRRMDFKLTSCGSDGKDLCVRLLAARGGAKTWQTKPYIGKLVIKRAKPAGDNVWRGIMKFSKYELSGTMTLNPGVSFNVSGCAYLVICDEISLIPAK
jgi:hypothetical protein